MRIPLSRPDITELDIERVVEVLRSGQLSLGPVLEEFEKNFSEYVGAKHAVAVSSGTAALHLAMLTLNLQPADEVITTPFSFVASANCALMTEAIPVFVDIDADTWNIDVGAIPRAITARTRAILPVHVFGQPARMDVVQDIAVKEGLAIVEDAAEALGARFDEQPVGSFGESGIFAFYPNKQMTTGEGGMLVTNHETIAALARSLRNQGRDHMGAWLAHQRLGYNYRLSDINAALGVSQLSRIESLLQSRQQVANWYQERLKGEDRLRLQHVLPNVRMSWFVYVVRLIDDYDPARRDQIIRKLRARDIGCSNYFSPIHLQPFYREKFGYKPGDFPKCEQLADRTIALPFHSNLTQAEVDEVCGELKTLL